MLVQSHHRPTLASLSLLTSFVIISLRFQIDALMASLEEIRNDDPSVKCLVVSQFTSFLNLIQIPLRRAGFSYTRLDGTMSQQERVESINSFMEKSDEAPTIMLLSLNAGGVGLTLTAATRVFLMDPVRIYVCNYPQNLKECNGWFL